MGLALWFTTKKLFGAVDLVRKLIQVCVNSENVEKAERSFTTNQSTDGDVFKHEQ